MSPEKEDHTLYVTITRGMRGWFAVMMWWNDIEPDLRGFWEPWQSGIGSYETPEGANKEAEAEGCRYVAG